jgi:dTDP-glucose pyrophosphorylase
MIEWRDAVVRPDSTLRLALAVIDRAAAKIALVCDESGHLLGTLTDGDIRRTLIAGRELSSRVDASMKRTPAFASQEWTREEAVALMRNLGVLQLPVLDDQGRVIGLHSLLGDSRGSQHTNWVVLMAGGEGRRLRPMTENLPKPMLPVGGRPILETVLSEFVDQGFERFFFSVNYMRETIRTHFGGGERWGARISYIDEDAPMGTAGALSLLPQAPIEPVFVMNADLLTRVNFEAILEFHSSVGAVATMCVREHTIEIPYGVVEMEGGRILSVAEKPKASHFINAGIYLLSPEAVAAVPHGIPYDMTSLFRDLIARGAYCASFPVYEYWLDIGRASDFERAHGDFAQHFGQRKGGR